MNWVLVVLRVLTVTSLLTVLDSWRMRLIPLLSLRLLGIERSRKDSSLGGFEDGLFVD